MKRETRNPPVTELKPNVHQIRGQDSACHAYLIRGTRKSALIDTGVPSSIAHLEESFAHLGMGIDQVDFVVLTHEHVDHLGSVPHFAKTSVVAAHRLAANKIALQDEFALMHRTFNHPLDRFRADVALEDDCVIDLGGYQLRVVHTPGHTSGSICLYEPNHKLLFTGDSVLAGGNLGGVFESGSISDYIQSMARLSALRVAAIYPGHGPTSNDPATDLQAAGQRARSLLEESQELFEAVDYRASVEHLVLHAKNLNHRLTG